MNIKNHMVISIDARKKYDKIQHQFMIQTVSKVRIQETPQHNKGHT